MMVKVIGMEYLFLVLLNKESLKYMIEGNVEAFQFPVKSEAPKKKAPTYVFLCTSEDKGLEKSSTISELSACTPSRPQAPVWEHHATNQNLEKGPIQQIDMEEEKTRQRKKPYQSLSNLVVLIAQFLVQRKRHLLCKY
jgi:hypothetical protein